MKRISYRHTVLFGDGTLYPVGSAEHQEGQFMPTVGDAYETWHLVPSSSRPTISMPGVETKFVTIPGMDGSYDLSQFLRKERPAFGDRSGSLEFTVENDFDVSSRNEEFWMTIYPKILGCLHGKRLKMVLKEDDPDFYWEGRFTVDRYDPDDGFHSKVTISYALSPFKRRIRKLLDGMVWDNFNFERDYDYDPWHLEEVSAGFAQNIWGEGYPFVPEVTLLSGESITVFFGDSGATYHSDGTVEGTLGRAKYGWNWLEVSGPGTASINWRGGSL